MGEYRRRTSLDLLKDTSPARAPAHKRARERLYGSFDVLACPPSACNVQVYSMPERERERALCFVFRSFVGALRGEEGGVFCLAARENAWCYKVKRTRESEGGILRAIKSI